MGIFKRLKPRVSFLGIDSLTGKNIIYMCRTKVLDKVIIERAGKDWDEDFANKMDEISWHYFIVTNKKEIGLVPGNIIDAVFKSKGINMDDLISVIPPTLQQPAAKECFEFYIKHIASR
jgi:hypothetical protein